MHPEALRGVQWALCQSGLKVPLDHHWTDVHSLRCLDVGGADVNGSARRIVDSATRRLNLWAGLDIAPAPGVDIVADARKPVLEEMRGVYDLVLCTEVFEHVQDWSSIVISIHEWLKPGGIAIMTFASTGRRPHGARGALDPAPGEWYQNVAEESLCDVLETAKFEDWQTKYNPFPGDVYAWARKATD